ncbi:MAG: hypothetical protein ACQEQM_08555 [Thermoplasmatota archaeon]
MSNIDIDHQKSKSHNLEEVIALGMYRHKKEKMMEIIDKINERYGGKSLSIEEVRESLARIDGSMSDYIISERE